jgi:hypothetical protein
LSVFALILKRQPIAALNLSSFCHLRFVISAKQCAVVSIMPLLADKEKLI